MFLYARHAHRNLGMMHSDETVVMTLTLKSAMSNCEIGKRHEDQNNRSFYATPPSQC